MTAVSYEELTRELLFIYLFTLDCVLSFLLYRSDQSTPLFMCATVSREATGISSRLSEGRVPSTLMSPHCLTGQLICQHFTVPWICDIQ